MTYLKNIRRGILLFLILPLAFACAPKSDSVTYRPEGGNGSAQQEATVMAEKPEESDPLPVGPVETILIEPEEIKAPLMSTQNAKADTTGIELSVTGGEIYGTGIVCWIDGFGLCYDLKTDPAKAVLSVEQEAVQDIEPFETHRLLLTADGKTYCLAELRFDTLEPEKKTLYGLKYDLVIMDSDLVDLAPSGADWEKIAPMEKNGETVFDYVHAGIICGFDGTGKTIDVMTVETAGFSEEYGIVLLPDTFRDEWITLKVPDGAVLALQGDEYELLLTRDRFFALLSESYSGFIGNEENEDMFTGCFIGYNENTLRYLCEISGETD